MHFNVGDHLVYPLYGAGTVVGVSEKNTDKGNCILYEIEFPFDRLTLSIPEYSSESVGLRPVMKEQEISEIMNYIRNNNGDKPNGVWTKIQKDNIAKLRSGNIYSVADVFKYLTYKKRKKTLSSVEQKILTNVQKILISEIHFAGNLGKEQIETLFKGLL